MAAVLQLGQTLGVFKVSRPAVGQGEAGQRLAVHLSRQPAQDVKDQDLDIQLFLHGMLHL